jgi:hypothetical protein
MGAADLPDCRHALRVAEIPLYDGERLVGYKREVFCNLKNGTVPPSRCSACYERETRALIGG